MSWRQDSSAGAYIWDSQPMSDEDLLGRNEEIRWLMAHERQQWGLINGRLKEKCEPEAYGSYAGLAANVVPGTLANVPSINGEGALWTTLSYTPWLARTLVAPSAWWLFVGFQVVTSTTPASVTVNPRVGAITSGASSTGGVQMGADASITLTASITTNWVISGRITVRSIGIPGTNSTAHGIFNTEAKPATAGNGPTTVDNLFGYTAASFDASVDTGVVMGMANTVTTINYQVNQIHWISLF